jgi:hypothetical protein
MSLEEFPPGTIQIARYGPARHELPPGEIRCFRDQSGLTRCPLPYLVAAPARSRLPFRSKSRCCRTSCLLIVEKDPQSNEQSKPSKSDLLPALGSCVSEQGYRRS